jgi:MFS family permease
MFPITGYILKDSGVEIEELGLYYGMMASSFILGKLVSYYIWVALANSCGRRPIFNSCLLLESVVVLAFGVASEFYSLLLLRFLAGFFSLNIFVAKVRYI